MLSPTQLNGNLLRAEYAVRGPIVERAQELEAAGTKIIYCNIGNPQALGQRPLTYLRQLLCLVEYPELMDRDEVHAHFPKDIVERARRVLHEHPAGTGAYTQSAGIMFVRQAVAEFIARRDGVPADPRRIILTDGASKGAQAVLTVGPEALVYPLGQHAVGEFPLGILAQSRQQRPPRQAQPPRAPVDIRQRSRCHLRRRQTPLARAC